MSVEITKLQVFTVIPVATKGFVPVTARTRMGKDKKEIPADQKSRSILIAELTPNVDSKYAKFVTDALYSAAKNQLEDQWEKDPQLKEVDAALYTEDSILAYWATKAESKKLTAESIAAWFEESALKKSFVAKYSAAQISKFAKELQHISAPVLSSDIYNEEKALKRIATLGSCEEDAENDIVAAMIRKLTAYVDRIRKVREEIGSVDSIDA